MVTTLLFLTHVIIVMVLGAKIIFRRLPVGTSLAWIFIVSVFPLFGFGLYMLIGDHRLGRKRLKHGDLVRAHYQNELRIDDGAVTDSHPEVETSFYKIARVAGRETGFLIRSNNSVDILSDAEDMFAAIVNDIDSAETVCHLEFYIVHPEGRVLQVFRALIDAAARGVECKLIADHIGSKKFFRTEWPAKLREAGIVVIDSLPTGVIKTFFTRSDLRNHRKIIAIDRWISYCGSFNLADPDHFKIKAGVGKWVDVMLRIEGDASEALSVVFNTDFVIESSEQKIINDIPALPPVTHVSRAPITLKKPIQVLPSAPEMRNSVIFETLVSSIYAARRSVRITTPYFVPDESLVLALTNAAKRGINVQIIVPEKVDSFLARHASRSYYGDLFQAGVSIHEFREGLLHAKIILIDDEVCYLGTVNLDMRSFYLNLEITVALHSPEDCRAVDDILNRYMAGSTAVIPSEYLDENRSKFSIFRENLVRLAGPML